jgi:hypothetical protein
VDTSTWGVLLSGGLSVARYCICSSRGERYLSGSSVSFFGVGNCGYRVRGV